MLSGNFIGEESVHALHEKVSVINEVRSENSEELLEVVLEELKS